MSDILELAQITKTASFYASADVIDIKFTDGRTLEVYVAIDERARAHGLRGISSLDLGGMLFCYNTPVHTPFTMEGMSMDLDIAWFDEAGKLLGHETCTKDHPYPVIAPSYFSYVLECQAGTFQVGDLALGANG